MKNNGLAPSGAIEVKMKKSQRIVCRLSLSVFLVFILCALTSCLPIASDYAASYLDEYGIPSFDGSKLREVERVYMSYYVESLPDPKVSAERTAAIYFEKYHGKIDTGNYEAVTEAVIRSYVSSIGDRYSVYRSAVEYAGYDTEMSGTFYGIGVLVTKGDGDCISVKEVYEGGGAEAAGILAGDVIVAVAGKEISEIGYESAVNLIRGEENTKVSVTVERAGARIDFSVERRKVVEKSVSYSIDENKIGYIKISSFKDNTDEMFCEAVDALTEQGAVGIIYDLRANPGGYLSSVISALSYIAPDGTTIVSFSDNYARPKKDSNPHELKLPAVVICDGGTASAGELFTAAMRDFDRELGYIEVTVVGEKTYGKGIMQTTVTLRDGSTVTLTVAYYNPPSGVNYHGEGIIPDVEITPINGTDAQLSAAYLEIYKLIN